jgi:hypothetical protein
LPIEVTHLITVVDGTGMSPRCRGHRKQKRHVQAHRRRSQKAQPDAGVISGRTYPALTAVKSVLKSARQENLLLTFSATRCTPSYAPILCPHPLPASAPGFLYFPIGGIWGSQLKGGRLVGAFPRIFEINSPMA